MKGLKKLIHWLDDRTGISEIVIPFAKHLVPPGSKWAYVFGSATLFTFILQVITGVALSLLYQPTSETAYESLKYITYEAPLGYILRGIHYYGASAMIFLVGVHMIRVYLFAAYKYPREMSWITGTILLLLTLGMGFTGQLLRWDSNGVWSAIVGAEQAGRFPYVGLWLARFLLAGETLGGATLSRFFSFHVFLIPALMFGLVGLHLYLVIHHGISEPPKSGQPVEPSKYRAWYEAMLKKEGVPFWPDAGWRDLAFGLLVIVIVILLAIFDGPPQIGAPPDPSTIYTNPRPDWYFLWIFAVFALMPRGVESAAIVLGPLIAGVVLILLPIFFNKGERSPLRRPWSIAIVVLIITMVASFWYEGSNSFWSPDFSARALSARVVGKLNPDAEAGSVLFYKKACMFCHSISGSGGRRGPDLTKVGNRLTEEEMTIVITNGSRNMPAFGSTLSAVEQKQLVAFLKTRKNK